MADAFEKRVDVYDAMIDWDKRLAHEEPFWRSVFTQVDAARVLDVACGTGRHAQRFAQWGLKAEGADLSEAMLARARQRAGESDALRWVRRGFEQPVDRPGSFDVALCVGNSLGLADSAPTMRAAVERMLQAVRPGGAVVVHVLNLWRLTEGVSLWQKCGYVDLAGQRRLMIKGVHRCGDRGFIDLLIAEVSEPALEAECPSFAGIEAADLQSWMRQAGAARVELSGGYRNEPYVRDKSVDLVAVGYRGG